MPDFRLPDLGEGLTEAEVLTWRVGVGDRVEVDQEVVEVETAKAVVAVPVPFAGVVAAIHAAPGTVVSVGQPLVTVHAEVPPAGLREPGAVTASAASVREEGREEASGSVLIGYGTSAAGRPPGRAGRRAARRAARAADADGAAAATGAAAADDAVAAGMAAAGPSGGARRGGPVAVISPLVRKIARDARLDLGGVAGTGPDGLIRRADVRRALAARDASGPGPAAAAERGASAPEAGGHRAGPGGHSAGPGERRIPLRGARRAAAEKLSRSRREIPEATVWVDADATGLLAARRDLSARGGAPVSLLALVARFALLGLARYPELNARVEADAIVIPGHVHLGFAAQTGAGLVVPVVRDAHRLTTRALSAALAERTAAARGGTLGPADLTGGTFTVNNYGVFGVDGSAAIINYPQAAILGLGRVTARPWVVDGEVRVRSVCELTLAFDHRACDGGTAGGFLRYVADCVESPASALGDL